MDSDDRQLLLTTAWLFAQHGRKERARAMCAALVEDDPRDGVAAAAYAERLIEDGAAAEALEVLHAADFPVELKRAEALLETRALSALGRREESARRWKRYVEASKGGARKWI